jgi:hypothetical protein
VCCSSCPSASPGCCCALVQRRAVVAEKVAGGVVARAGLQWRAANGVQAVH